MEKEVCSCSGFFTPVKLTIGILWTEGWVHPKLGWLLLLPRIKPQISRLEAVNLLIESPHKITGYENDLFRPHF
jgi:hypothetical protein